MATHPRRAPNVCGEPESEAARKAENEDAPGKVARTT
jgi:hypothetical protein